MKHNTTVTTRMVRSKTLPGMKPIIKCLLAAFALTSALVLPVTASARPVTLNATLKNYGGDGAYLAVYLADPSGAYVRTLWVAGQKSKYYKHLSDWYRATSGRAAGIDGVTGASVGPGRQLAVTVELEEALIDAGYTLNIDAAAEDLRDSPHDVSVPLTRSGAGQTSVGKRYVAEFTYGL